MQEQHPEDPIMNKELHPQAEERATQYVNRFADLLLSQSKTLAHNEDAELVLQRHVIEAHEILRRKEKETRLKQFLLMFGSLFLGVFFSGFITEITKTPPSKGLIVVYVVLGFVGLLLAALGLFRY
jgi:hypothetical protein